MNYDLIVSDYDLTLTNSDRVITERTRATIKKFQDNGGIFVLCSARPLNALTPVINGIKVDAIIATQGASTYDLDKNIRIKKHPLLPEEVKEITTFLKPITPHIHLINDTEQRSKIFSFVEYGCNKIVNYQIKPIYRKIFNYYPEDGIFQVMTGSYHVEKIAPLLKILRDHFKDRYEIGLCDKRLINITHKDVTKGAAIQDIIEYYGLTKERAMAFGDSPNDASMFKYVKTGVAMGNSMEELKQYATDICGQCDNDGLARFIEEHVF